MRRLPSLIPLVVLVACGGGHKKVEKPVVQEEVAKPAPPPETEADRARKRHEQAVAIVPEGSTCLPAALKGDNAPRLELAAEGSDAVVCAVDTDPSRLLGPVGCWKIDLSSGALTYMPPKPMPGRDLDVLMTDKCARGFCLPSDSKAGDASVAHLAWSLDGKKVAMMVGDEVHLFDAGSQQHESTFNVRGDKGLTDDPIALDFVGDELFVEGAKDGKPTGVWVYKLDGTQVGPITPIGSKDNKPISPDQGAFDVLDKTQVGIAERGYTTLNTYDVDTGRRGKLVRKVGKLRCRKAEIEAFWTGGDKVTDRCRASMNKEFSHLIGATTVAGSKNFLALLRGDRLGQLVVLNAKTLVEKKTIKMPWCDKGGDTAAPADAKAGK